MEKGVPSITALGDACCGCGACAAKCPKNCIEMVPDGCGFLRPTVDWNACIGCSGCDSVCPALVKWPKDEIKGAIWAKSKDRPERLRSSSGGVFALLAHDVLGDGGVVVGATWDEGCKHVRHVLVDSEDALDSVMRSKYVQSSVGREIYKSVRDAVRTGRRVLFTGTACQVAGMRAYLGKLADFDDFLAVDVICHGVPSPLLWERWAEYREDQAGAPLCDVNMRSKTTGWLSYSAMYEYMAEKDRTPVYEGCVFGDDWYMKAFLANASLRPSCFCCPAKRTCGSDITLGDFWGIQSAHPEIDCEGGVSAVLCNTTKGITAIEAVKAGLDWGVSSPEKVISGNPSLIKSVTPYGKRDEFLKDFEAGATIETMVRTHRFQVPFHRKILAFLRGTAKRVLKPVIKIMKGN